MLYLLFCLYIVSDITFNLMRWTVQFFNIFTYGNSVLSAFPAGQNLKCKFVLRPCFDT